MCFAASVSVAIWQCQFAASVIAKFDNAVFGNSGKVTCRCAWWVCECQIFDIFTKVFCRQCNDSNLAMQDLGILAK